MQQKNWYQAVRGISFPLLTSVLGLILLLNPDVASAMLGQIAGWILVAAGISAGVFAVLSRPIRITPLILGIVALILGIYLLVNPMALARNIGKIVGIILVIQGISNLFQLQELRDYGLSVGKSWIVPIFTLIIGLFLIFFPVSASRVVFRIIGLILLASGILNLIERLRSNYNKSRFDRPDIIDADD